MSFVAGVIDALEVPEKALEALSSAQTRQDIADHLHSILSNVVDLAQRVLVLEHPGSTQQLVALAVQINALNTRLAVAQAEQAKNPSGSNAAQVILLQQQIAQAKTSAAAAISTPDAVSGTVAVLRELLASAAPAPTPAPAEGTSSAS